MPKSTYELKLPKIRDAVKPEDFFTITIAEPDEDVFVSMNALIEKGKSLDAVKVGLRMMYQGGDPIEEVCKNFHAVSAAIQPITDLLTPQEAVIKKN